MQANRKAFIDKLLAEGIISQIRVSGNVPDVYVTQAFMNGDIQDKESIVSVIYAFYFDGSNPQHFVQLLDSRTGNPVGSYSLIAGGLRMTN